MGIDVASLQASMTTLNDDALRLASQAIAPAQSTGQAGEVQDSSFSQAMQAALGKVNQDDRLAADKMGDVDSGKSDDLVGAMLASQEASLSFSMLMQVRNKVMGAVDELIKLSL